MTANTFAIGEVAAMLGLSPHTIRAWERRHLVVHPARTSSGHRRYSADDVDLLRQIKHERHMHGLSMRMATLTAHGLVVPEAPSAARPAAPAEIPGAGDPLRTVADLVAEVVVSVDDAGRITHANSAFARFADSTPAQLRGHRFSDFVEPADRAAAAEALQAPPRQRRDCVLGLRTRRSSVRYTFDCWPVPAGQAATLLLVGRRPKEDPIPEPLVAPAAAAPAGTVPRLRALLDGVADPMRTLALVADWLDGLPEGIVLTRADAALSVLFANRAARQLVPAAHLPLEDRPWLALQRDADGERLAAAASAVVRSGEPRGVAGVQPGEFAAGPVAWDVEVCPVTDIAGEIRHLALVVTGASATGGLGVLARTAQALADERDPSQLLRAAGRDARELLPNAGCVLAVAGEDGALAVVAASGVWAGEPRQRMRLVEDAARTGAPIEVVAGERAGGETVRVVPVGTRGALGYARQDGAAFSGEERALVDEFAARLGIALSRRPAGSGRDADNAERVARRTPRRAR